MSGDTTGSLDQLILELERVGAVKFGEFKLKSGLFSPVYFDLRVLVSFPKLMGLVASYLLEFVTRRDVLVCGVPYTALPIASIMSLKADIGMVVRRKEAKDYGTKKMVEGIWKEGDNCVIVEDVITSGGSVRETADLLREHGMEVSECVVLLDREQGARQSLSQNGIKVHSLLTVSRVLEVLFREGRISGETVQSVKIFLNNNQSLGSGKASPGVLVSSLESRLAGAGDNKVLGRLLNIMLSKQSNLCVAVDKQRAEQILAIVKQIGPSVAVIKLHADIVEDWTPDTETELKRLAAEMDFLLFEDRKLADIGNTVTLQTARFASWADLVTVHGLPGSGVIQGVREAVKESRGLGVLLVSEMSNSGNLFNPAYTQAVVKLGEDNKDIVLGFIAQSRVSQDGSLVQFTPGVHISEEGDSKDQQYSSPAHAVLHRGADLIIVGRGITGAEQPATEAEKYRQLGWQAYLSRVDIK